MRSVIIAGLVAALATAATSIEAPLDNRAANCVILLDSSSSYPYNPPIITDPAYGYIYPDGTYYDDDRNIVVVDGEYINLSCAATQFEDSALSGVEFLTARCTEGQFAVTPLDGSEMTDLFDFIDLGCDRQPDERSSEPGFACGPDDAGIEIQYGFDTYSGFTALFGVCFDEPGARTFYAQHTLYHNIKARDTGNERPDFQEDGYYDFDVNEKYTQVQQQITIEELTGSSSYVDTDAQIFLSRGHFSPNSDFVYYSLQDATYYFVNVGPQWQCFNGGNWVDIENACRYYVENHDVDLIVYTGTHGVLQLADTSGEMVDIYLYPETTQLPVSMYYWKVLYNPDDNTGVAIIGVNNPHLTAAQIPDFTICNPIEGNEFMSEVDDPNDLYRGIVYACEVAEAAAVFEEIPDLGNLGILG